MGFPAQRRLHITFAEDTEFFGLEAVMLRGSIGQIEEWLDSASSGDESLSRKERDEAMLSLAASLIVSWNVQNDWKELIPISVEGLRTCEPGIIGALMREWVNASTGVSRPLESASPNGEPFPEESIPMEVL